MVGNKDKEVRELSYRDRIVPWNLPTLEKRRKSRSMNATFKFLNQFGDINSE